jgi:CheY-like chemotaxis protein
VTDRPLNKILCVEDETDIQEVLEMALVATGGFTVLICGSGREALRQAAEFAPDLILLDVMMPEMDGPSTLRALRQAPEAAGTPVIFMTAKAQPHEINAYKKMGALGVITKPFDPMHLTETIRSLWSQPHE